jgi:beta-glucosidase
MDAAQSADAVVVCVGEGNYAEKAGDIDDLLMSGSQRELLAALTAVEDVPVAVVLVEGRPRVLDGTTLSVMHEPHTLLSKTRKEPDRVEGL